MLGWYIVRGCRGWNHGRLRLRRRGPYVRRCCGRPSRGILALNLLHWPGHGIRRPARVRGGGAKLWLRRKILGFAIVHMIIVMDIFYGGWRPGRRRSRVPCWGRVGWFGGIVVDWVAPGIPVEVIHRLRGSSRGNAGDRTSRPSDPAEVRKGFGKLSLSPFVCPALGSVISAAWRVCLSG